MAALILLGLLVAAGLCAMVGWGTDSRDPDYSAGRLLSRNHPGDSAVGIRSPDR